MGGGRDLFDPKLLAGGTSQAARKKCRKCAINFDRATKLKLQVEAMEKRQVKHAAQLAKRKSQVATLRSRLAASCERGEHEREETEGLKQRWATEEATEQLEAQELRGFAWRQEALVAEAVSSLEGLQAQHAESAAEATGTL